VPIHPPIVLVIVVAFLPFSPTIFKIEDEHEHDLGEDEDEHAERWIPLRDD
jgi:hypothetical protein